MVRDDNLSGKSTDLDFFADLDIFGYRFNFLTRHDKAYIRVIPQGTVDNNLGPDRLAGLKALDAIADNQPFDCTAFVCRS